MNVGNVDDVNPLRAMKNIVQEVMEYVNQHRKIDEFGVISNYPTDFETYDQALHAVWPELHKVDPKAHLLVAVSIYVEIAERWDFKDDILEILKGFKL